jgi:hypothetical protein
VHNVGTSALTGSVKRDKGAKAGVGETDTGEGHTGKGCDGDERIKKDGVSCIRAA